MENDHIRADCIEATEFPDLATQYHVYAVPRTVINETEVIEGSVPEAHFLERVLKAVEEDQREMTNDEQRE